MTVRHTYRYKQRIQNTDPWPVWLEGFLPSQYIFLYCVNKYEEKRRFCSVWTWPGRIHTYWRPVLYVWIGKELWNTYKYVPIWNAYRSEQKHEDLWMDKIRTNICAKLEIGANTESKFKFVQNHWWRRHAAASQLQARLSQLTCASRAGLPRIAASWPRNRLSWEDQDDLGQMPATYFYQEVLQKSLMVAEPTYKTAVTKKGLDRYSCITKASEGNKSLE